MGVVVVYTEKKGALHMAHWMNMERRVVRTLLTVLFFYRCDWQPLRAAFQATFTCTNATCFWQLCCPEIHNDSQLLPTVFSLIVVIRSLCVQRFKHVLHVQTQLASGSCV